ncbi:MAG: lipid IV(A) 3-deoxy-D-manno-octulosonic acid transferase [Gammaproteobacteria bacterium]
MSILRNIYSLLFYLALPFILLRLQWKGRKNPAYKERWNERLAWYPKETQLSSSIWIHAVSLGESVAAIPLIKALQARYPEEKIIVTNMTPTGAEKIRATFGDEVLQLYVPYDYPGAIKRYLRHFNPRLLIIMETELWPNLLYYSAKKNIPVLLANARLSPHSFNNYLRFKPLVSKMLSCITNVAAQSAADGERFLELGLTREKLIVAGNIKFDLNVAEEVYKAAQTLQHNWKLSDSRPVWIAASTHPGEEEIILSAAKRVLQTLPDALLILVPRHPERFNDVAALCAKQGFNCVRYSENPMVSTDTQVIIGDTIGKLLSFYALAKVAFVGGSLVPIGGHNLLEPAALGAAVLTGPELHNFREISELLLTSKALILVKNDSDLVEQVLRLLQDKSSNAIMVKAGKEVIAQNKGALNGLVAWVEKNYSNKQ